MNDEEPKELPINQEEPKENNDKLNNNKINVTIKDVQGEVYEMELAKEDTIKKVVTQYRVDKKLADGCQVLLYFNGKGLKDNQTIGELENSKKNSDDLLFNCVIRLRCGKNEGL